MAREPWMTDDQWECAQMFADVVGGFHHVGGKFRPFGSGIKVSDYQFGWATFDCDRLTRLVILAHDQAIRVAIVSSSPGRVGFKLWKRHTREGSMHERHPTIEQAIATHRRSKTDD
jgi:hypothetical protein